MGNLADNAFYLFCSGLVSLVCLVCFWSNKKPIFLFTSGVGVGSLLAVVFDFSLIMQGIGIFILIVGLILYYRTMKKPIFLFINGVGAGIPICSILFLFLLGIVS